jgi:phosphoribosylanthranilate isomerase
MSTAIKFCGLVRPHDAEVACNLGVEAIGMVMYPGSSRFLTRAEALEVREAIRPGVMAVGLFVNALPLEVIETAQALRLDVLQFHGDESAQACVEIAAACKLPFWRAVRMREANHLTQAARENPTAQALLLDAHVQGYGGAGQTFDWSWVPPIRPEGYPKVILAGGLNAGNVAQGIARTRPWMVDVSSAVQGDSAREKDFVKMERFVTAVRTISP